MSAPPGDRWFVDETYAKVTGRWTYLYRAIDQFGQVIDVLAAEKRDLAAARRFFAHALEQAPRPSEVITARAPAYLRVLDEVLPGALHVVEQYANNSIEAGLPNVRLHDLRHSCVTLLLESTYACRHTSLWHATLDATMGIYGASAPRMM